MSALVPFASPWWVNLCLLVPGLPFLLSKEKITFARTRLLIAALFGIAFGFVEAAVVVYLRATLGLLPGPPANVAVTIPASLLKVECFREAATLVMLGAISWLTAQNLQTRVAAFLWTFAFWDFFYYVWLRVLIGWPGSLLDTDVLFLIPRPWVAQVWFPLLISLLTAIAVWIRTVGTSSETRSMPS
jgi:hypothetical protein